MSELHTPATNRLLDAVTAIDDPVLSAMEQRAAQEGFPTVGAGVGRFLRLLVFAGNVSRIFECGSGFGYSAYWMATALPPDGEIVLTEIDEHELADARSYFEDGGLAERARFESGNALELLEADETSYDLVFLDHEKERYADGLALARERLASGGLLVADNACKTAAYGPEAVARALEESAGEASSEEAAAGVATYCRRIVADDAFETSLVPLGEGVLVAVKRPER